MRVKIGNKYIAFQKNRLYFSVECILCRTFVTVVKKRYMITLAIVWDPPLGIDLGFITLRYYSLMWLAAFAVGLWLFNKMARRDSMSEEEVGTMLLYVFFGTLIGSRLGHCIFYEWDYYSNHILEMILPFQISPFKFTGYQGLASHGAAIGIPLAVWILSRRIKRHFLWLMDRLVIVVALGGAFIRLGNFFNSEIVGLPSGSSYGVIFRALGENIPRHPTQLYESVAYMALFVLLSYIYKRGWVKAEGLIFGIFMVWLFGMRIIIEFFKENQSAFEEGMMLNMGQILSIPFIIAGIILIFTASKRVYPSKINKK